MRCDCKSQRYELASSTWTRPPLDCGRDGETETNCFTAWYGVAHHYEHKHAHTVVLSSATGATENTVYTARTYTQTFVHTRTRTHTLSTAVYTHAATIATAAAPK